MTLHTMRLKNQGKTVNALIKHVFDENSDDGDLTGKPGDCDGWSPVTAATA